MKIRKEFKFEMAHVLSNYNGPCGNLHGHSYRCIMEFTPLSLGKIHSEGMVLDFNDVKKLVGEKVIDAMDHAFAYNSVSTDPFEKQLAELCIEHGKKTIGFPHRTTAELMSRWIYRRVNDILGETDLRTQVMCSGVTLYETTTGCAIYEGQA